MKTLDQLEPRTPLKAGAPGVVLNANGGFTITASGSYYLTANLTIASGNAIAIQASGVTLDLSGFTLSSTTVSPADGTGVYIADNLSDITIRNGHIRGNTVFNESTKNFSGTGFRNGITRSSIYFVSSSHTNTLAENISVSNVAGDGIANFTIIDKCAASFCGVSGLVAYQVLNSSAVTCGATAVRADSTASNCYGLSTTAIGIDTYTASNCFGYSDSRTGIDTYTASNCHGYSISGEGIGAYTASNCTGSSTSDTGLSVKTALNCYGNSKSGTGLSADTASNCFGYSSSGTGLRASKIATGCYGRGADGIYIGSLDFSGSAENCRGDAESGTGIFAETATNCFGTSISGTGLRAGTASNCTAFTQSGPIALHISGTANTCRGHNLGGGPSIQADIAIGCTAGNGPINTPADKKFLGTP
jgi:hypothetical protein